MKISIYELLGMVKDGKAPKKIKYEDRTYTLYLDEKNNHYYQDDKCEWYMLSISCFEKLNEEVEILEEEKKIPEKLETYKENNEMFLESFCYKYMPIHKDSLSFNEQVILDKINSIIDYLKSKGE